MKTSVLRAGLLDKPKIYRDIAVSDDTSLYKLAEVIIDAFNFDFDHAFGFFSKITDGNCYDSPVKYELFTDMKGQGIEPTGAGSVERTKVLEVWKKSGDRMLFLFDYGDDWRFVVELIAVGEKVMKSSLPRLLKKVGRAPKQY